MLVLILHPAQPDKRTGKKTGRAINFGAGQDGREWTGEIFWCFLGRARIFLGFLIFIHFEIDFRTETSFVVVTYA